MTLSNTNNAKLIIYSTQPRQAEWLQNYIISGLRCISTLFFRLHPPDQWTIGIKTNNKLIINKKGIMKVQVFAGRAGSASQSVLSWVLHWLDIKQPHACQIFWDGSEHEVFLLRRLMLFDTRWSKSTRLFQTGDASSCLSSSVCVRVNNSQPDTSSHSQATCKSKCFTNFETCTNLCTERWSADFHVITLAVMSNCTPEQSLPLDNF